MTIDPVASSIELYSRLLENAYARAEQNRQQDQQQASTGHGETSTSTTQATVNYQLSVTVNARQEQRTTRGPSSDNRGASDNGSRGTRGNGTSSTALSGPATRQQTLLDVSGDEPEPDDGQYTFELEYSEILPRKRDARFATAANTYSRTARGASNGGQSEVGATFSGVA